VVQRGGGARLAGESGADFGAAGQPLVNDLDGDVAAERQVLGLVDDPIPPSPSRSRIR